MDYIIEYLDQGFSYLVDCYKHAPEIINEWHQIHFRSGHRPLFYLTEHTVDPRGFWLAYRLPVSYYSSNTVFYHWPVDFHFWRDVLRGTSFLSHAPVFSYKEVSSLLLENTSYWCKFTFWDLVSQAATGWIQIRATYNSSYNVTFFENSLFELRVVHNPYFYDMTWEEWFLKTDFGFFTDYSDRLGSSVGQRSRRIFFQGVLWGYWAYLISYTPWPWRIRYPRRLTSLFWVQMTDRYFFRRVNKWNPYVLQLTCLVLGYVLYYSTLTVETYWEAPSIECFEDYVFAWIYFVASSLFVWLPLQRLAGGVLYPFLLKVPSSLSCLADILSGGWPLRRQKYLQFLTASWLWFSFTLSVFWLYFLFSFLNYLWVLVCKFTYLPIKWLLFTFIGNCIFNPIVFLSAHWLEFIDAGDEIYSWVKYLISNLIPSVQYLVYVIGLVLAISGWYLSLLWAYLYPIYIRKYLVAHYPGTFCEALTYYERARYTFWRFFELRRLRKKERREYLYRVRLGLE